MSMWRGECVFRQAVFRRQIQIHLHDERSMIGGAFPESLPENGKMVVSSVPGQLVNV